MRRAMNNQRTLFRSRITDAVCFLAVVVLPWQARWIYGQRYIGGEAYEYGVLSIYAGTIVLAFALAMLWLRKNPAIRVSLNRALTLQNTLNFMHPQSRALIAGFLLVLWLVIISSRALDSVIAFHALFIALCAFGYYLLARWWKFDGVLTALISMGFVQSIIAWHQFIFQKVWASTVLGVAEHAPYIPGESVVSIAGNRILRAYALFSHPNILGGVLVVALVAAVYMFARTGQLKTPRALMKWGIGMATVMIIFSGVLISFSRTPLLICIALASGGVIAVFVTKFKNNARFFMQAVVACLAIFFIFNVFTNNAWLQRAGLVARSAPQAELDYRSTTERVAHYAEAGSLISFKTLSMGVGLGNYVPHIASVFSGRPSYAYQPVHNALVLMSIEIGMVGVVLAGLLLVTLLHGTSLNMRRPFTVQKIGLIMFSVVGILSLLDHYLWTQYSGQALVWLLLGVVASEK